MKKILLFLILLLLPAFKVNAAIYLDDYQLPFKVGVYRNGGIQNDFSYSDFITSSAGVDNNLYTNPRFYYSTRNSYKEMDFVLYLNQSLLENRYYLISMIYQARVDSKFSHKNFEDSVTNGDGSISHYHLHPYFGQSYFEILEKGETSSYNERTDVSVTSFLIKTSGFANVLRFSMKSDKAFSFAFYGYQITYVGDDETTTNQIQSKIDSLNTNINNQFKFSNDLANKNSQNEINAMNKNQEQANKNSQAEIAATNKNTEATKEQTDYLKDDTAPTSDISALGDVTGIFPPGPLDSLLNIPFRFLSILTSSFSGTCVPITGTWVFNQTLTIPCFSDMFYDNVPIFLMSFVDLIPAVFILIKYLKHLYKKIDRAVSMETNSDDEWGVI